MPNPAHGRRYVRERNDGLFRPVTYLVFKLVDELALNWIVSLASCGIIYGGCRLSGSFVYFWLMLTSTLSNGVGKYLRCFIIIINDTCRSSF